MRRRAALLGLLAVAACGGDAEPAAPPPNVVLITLDTTRADHLSCYGYERPTSPTLDALAARGTRFADAWAGSAETGPSLATTLTSRRPPVHGVRANAERLDPRVRTLADAASERGYATGAFVSTVLLKAAYSAFDRGFDVYDDEQTDPCFGHENAQRIAERTVDAARAWIDGHTLDGNTAPYFAWVHLYDPHGPYTPPERSARLETSRESLSSTELPRGAIPGYQRVGETRDSADYVDRYDHEIAYADAQIARLLEGVDPERTLVVVHADHGEALGEDAYWFRHGSLLHDPALRIPLVMAGPGVPAGRVEDARIRTLDIAPTIAALLGWSDALPSAEGRAWTPDAPFPDVSVIAEARVRERIRDGTGIDTRWKVRLIESGPPAVDATWWPRADERLPVSTPESVIERLKAWLAPPWPPADDGKDTPEADAALEALGYK